MFHCSVTGKLLSSSPGTATDPSKSVLLLVGALGDIGSEIFLFCCGSCCLLVSSSTFPSLSHFEGKKLGLFLPVLSGFSAAGDFPELVSTSADTEYFVFQKKPYLTSPRLTGILQRASPGPTPDFQPKRDVRQERSLINAPSSLASGGL